MGLDTTHDAWHGAYSAFSRWREKLAEIVGIPLGLMEGYYHNDPIDKWLPISWEALKPDVLHILLDHSDAEGEIVAEDCGPLADRLEELLPLLPEEKDWGHIGSWREKTQTFIDGLRLAASRGENIEFH
jgi:hypothetical protein